MTVYTAAITQVGTEPAVVRKLAVEPRYCLRITFGPSQVVYIISHDDAVASLPTGASYLKSRLSGRPMPDLNRNAGFESGKSTSPTTSYEIADVDDELNALFANKNLNGEGTLNRLIEDFEFDLNQPLQLDPYLAGYTPPKYTGIIQNHSRVDYNSVLIETSDINRKIDDDVFEPYTWRLKESITGTQDTIKTTLPVNLIDEYQATWQHAEWYLENPNQIGGYAIIEDEVFFYSEFKNVGGIGTFTGVVRGQCGTTSAGVDIADNVEEGNRPEISSVFVFHEPITDIPKALITGYTADGRKLPDNCAIKEDPRWIDESSFAKHSQSLKLRFELYKKQKCRDFYEKEVLSLAGAVLGTDGRGRLGWIPRQRPTDTAAGEIVLDPSNCPQDIALTLRHVKTNIHPSFKIGYNWNEAEEKALSTVVYRDEQSEVHNGIPAGQKQKTFLFKGLRSGIHTSNQLNQLAATYGDEYFYEKQELSIESFINDIPLGTLVTADFPEVRDDANGLITSLKRTMLVVATRESRQNRTTTYTLSGSLNIQSARQAGLKQHNASAEEYKRGKINIATLAGITIEDGVATGNITLEMGRNYYYVDDASLGTGLEFSASMNVTIAGTGPFLGIYVFGPFDCKATIDLSERSDHRAGKAGTSAQSPTQGESGYAVSVRSSGPFDTRVTYGSSLSGENTIYNKRKYVVTAISTGVPTSSRNAKAPIPVLNLNNGIIGGIPSDLGGAAGSGSAVSTHYDEDRQPQSVASNNTTSRPRTKYVDGTDGGKAGGGLVIFSWSGAISNLILNGGNADPVNTLDRDGNTVFSGSRGAGGGPGSFLWVIDGNHAPPLLNGNNITALSGDGSVAGTPYGVGDGISVSSGGLVRSAAKGTPQADYWETVTQYTYTPEVEAVQQLGKKLSAIDRFFDTQPDGNAKLIISDVEPSNANRDDMYISKTELDDTANKQPRAFVLKRTGWERFNWSGANASFYMSLIGFYREYGTMTWHSSGARPVDYDDGDAWSNPLTGETYILRKSGRDELVKIGDVNVGRNLYSDGTFSQQQSANAAGVAGPWIIDHAVRRPRLINASSVIETGAGNSNTQPPRKVDVFVYPSNIEVVVGSPIDESQVSAYRVYRDGVRVSSDLVPPTRSYLDNAVVGGVSYKYSATAVDRNGVETGQKIGQPETVTAQDTSNAQPVSTLPDVSGLVIQRYSASSGEVQWTPPDDTRVTGYRLVRNDGGGTIDLSGRTTNSYYFSGLPDNDGRLWTIQTRGGDEGSAGRTAGYNL